MGVSKERIYDLVEYLNVLWRRREKCSINIERLSSSFLLNHEEIMIHQSNLINIPIECSEYLTPLEQLEYWCASHALTKYKIERVHRIIRPVGSCKKPQLSNSGYLISQFRWQEDDGTARSKNLPPSIYEIVLLAVSRGDTVKQINKLIENNGDRLLALGDSAHWVIPWEQELVELKLID